VAEVQRKVARARSPSGSARAARMTARTVTAGSGTEETCIAGSVTPTGCHHAPSAVRVGSGQMRSTPMSTPQSARPVRATRRTRRSLAGIPSRWSSSWSPTSSVVSASSTVAAILIRMPRSRARAIPARARSKLPAPRWRSCSDDVPGSSETLKSHAVLIEPLEQAPPGAAAENHRVGEDGDGGPPLGGGDELAELGIKERLSPGEEDLAAAETGELLASAAGDFRIEAARGA